MLTFLKYDPAFWEIIKFEQSVINSVMIIYTDTEYYVRI